MATSHLRSRVSTTWSAVHNFAAKLNHTCMTPQVAEQEDWPVAHKKSIS